MGEGVDKCSALCYSSYNSTGQAAESEGRERDEMDTGKANWTRTVVMGRTREG